MRRGQGAFEYILLLAGVLLIVVLAIIILRSAVPGTQVNLAQCKAQIAAVSVCTYANGTWYGPTPDGCGAAGCLYSEYAVSTSCVSAFSGTSWEKDATHFLCGSKPG